MDGEQNPLAAEEKGSMALAQQEVTMSDCENRGEAAENLEM